MKLKNVASKLRLDGFVSLLSGLGGSTDKTTQLGLAYSELSQESLDTLWDGNWLANRISSIFPDQAFKHGIESSDDAKLDELNRLNFPPRFAAGVFQTALAWGRHYGGAAIVLGSVRVDSLESPRKDNETLAFLDIVKKSQLEIKTLNTDPDSPDFGQPASYRIINHPRKDNTIHASRLIWCEGLTKAKPDENKPAGQWHSVLDPVLASLANYGLSFTAAAHLIQEASIGKLSMSGLIKMLGTQDEDLVQARIDALNAGRNVANVMLLDADGNEDFSRESIAFTGLADVITLLLLDVSGASKVPVTKLFGREPAGMNSTGESDAANFNAEIQSYITDSVLPKLKIVWEMLGGEPDDIDLPMPEQQTELEQAQIGYQNAQTYEVLTRSEILLPEQITLALHEAGELAGVELDDTASAFLKRRLAEIYRPQEESIETPASGGGSGGGDNVQQTALNGAQVSSLLEIVQSVAERRLPRQSGINLIVASFPINASAADAIMGPTGATFFIQEPSGNQTQSPDPAQPDPNPEQ